MNRAEHLSAARNRALALIAAGQVASALRAFVDHANRHPDCRIAPVREAYGMLIAQQGPDAVRSWIESVA